jgi:hypothetical protein
LAGRVVTYDLVVEIHIVDVEWNVLFGLPMNLLVEFFFGHRRKHDFFDDDSVPGKRRGDLRGLYVLVVPDSIDRVAHMIEIDYVSVDDRVGLKILMRDVDQFEPASSGLKLDGF